MANKSFTAREVDNGWVVSLGDNEAMYNQELICPSLRKLIVLLKEFFDTEIVKDKD